MADKNNLEYFIELSLENNKVSGSFNLWAKQKNKYYNLATLFYNDPMCGCDWSVSEIEKSVCYDKSALQDELESSLRPISKELGDKLASMDVSFKEAVEYLIKVCDEKGDIVGMKFSYKPGDKQNGE